jgi:hypothetical protein
MRKFLVGAVAAGTFVMASSAALAQGHIAGGVAGAAIAGKRHRVAGAVVGGAIGHHIAKKNAAKKQGPN